MWKELRTIIHAVSSADVRCVVLTSKLDKGFTAGLDGRLSSWTPLNWVVNIRSKADLAQSKLSYLPFNNTPQT